MRDMIPFHKNIGYDYDVGLCKQAGIYRILTRWKRVRVKNIENELMERVKRFSYD